MYEHIQVAEAEGILTITLNRPDRLNAFIGHMRRDLAEALEHAGSDRSVARGDHHRRRPCVLRGRRYRVHG